MSTIRKAVITAAGRGTRQYPATNSVQKELFPLVDTDGYTKPTLQIVIEEAIESGIEEICIVANPTNLEAIRLHFRGLTAAQRSQFAGKKWGLELSDKLDNIGRRLTFVVQEQQEGYGHAVYQAKDFVAGEPFLHLLGDHIYLSVRKRCSRQVIEQYAVYGEPVAGLSLVNERVISRYGIASVQAIDGSEVVTKILRIIEKPSIEIAREQLMSATAPEGYYYTFFGVHALPAVIFDYLGYLIGNDIRNKGEIQFASAQEMMLQESPRYIGLLIDGTRYDMGVPDGLIETQTALALHSPYASHLYEIVADVERQKRSATAH